MSGVKAVQSYFGATIRLAIGVSNVHDFQFLNRMIGPIDDSIPSKNQDLDFAPAPIPLSEVSSAIWVISQSAQEC